MRFENDHQLNRPLTKTSVLSLYGSFTVLVLIVFGIAGTRSNWQGIKEYGAKNAQLKEQKTKVKEKKAYLTQTEKALNNLSTQEKTLNNMIPQGENFEKYIEEIIAANTMYGYDVEKVSFTSSKPNQNEQMADVSITFKTENPDADLVGLVKSLEKTPRISIIEKLNFSTIANQKLLKVDLQIYLVK